MADQDRVGAIGIEGAVGFHHQVVALQHSAGGQCQGRVEVKPLRFHQTDGVLSEGSPEVFEKDGKSMEASIKRVVNYQKDNMDLCIFYDVDSEIPTGDYIVKIYCEQKEIASTSFSLK